MKDRDRVEARVRQMVAGMHDADPGELHLELRLLRGGLQAASVTRLRVHYRDANGRRRVHTLVVKRLVGPAAREMGVYQRLLSAIPAAAPQLLAADVNGPGEATLYLEALRPIARWPWKDVANARAVLERVAILHQAVLPDAILGQLSLWDYEHELLVSAERTLGLLQRLRHGAPMFRNGIRWARRLVSALPAVRRQLLSFRPFGTAPLHGDLHSGNVILRRHQGRVEPVLLDWGRARIGSPLEDVSSWLQSLGAWEPEARRRHDTLFGWYLAARGMERRLGRDLRVAYWLAGASNALAGALSYHLTTLVDERASSARVAIAERAARDWLRVLRRADACWG
jgi:Phosphotransferase enzyme family